MTFCWKAVEQYFSVVLLIFQFYLVCNFVKKFFNLDFTLSGVKAKGDNVDS